ncbi:toxin CngtIII-like [Centruroides sculpturatus]|uniref:toxin CngtIII-like n=1 Tax=Centruroides sculpturatus TaxID=218467 RepID=UPI000C6E18B8|nr:toxin CngtIII-like [Centruroides sculpturatus]
MNSLLMITACLVLIGIVWAKDGYLVIKTTGCKLSCLEDKKCDRDCKNQGGSYGYCHAFGCWCEGLSGSTPTYPIPGKTCKK